MDDTNTNVEAKPQRKMGWCVLFKTEKQIKMVSGLRGTNIYLKGNQEVKVKPHYITLT